jgi:TetR/AcrR family transcriptional regulator
MEERGGVKRTILNKALEMFSAKGYEGVSVNELTEAAGISKPTLYYYFGSKEGVFESVCQSHYARLNALITENAEYRPNPKSYNEDIFLTLTKVTAAYFSFAKENGDFYRIVLANLSMPPSSAVFEIVEKYHFTQFEVIEGMFRNMAKVHGNLKGKSKTLTWSLIGTINAHISLCFSGISALSLHDKTVKELVHQFMHGIYA